MSTAQPVEEVRSLNLYRYVTRLISKLLAIPAILCAGTAYVAIAAMLVATFSASLTSVAAQEPSTTAERETALKGFTDRVNAYITLKRKLQQDLPKPKPGDQGTGKAEVHEDTLASRLQIARKDSGAGDVFGDAAPIFKRIIERDTKTRGSHDAYAAMQEVPSKSPLMVNAAYPEKAALATVPPLILVNLPRLPDGLEYRFMGRDLILRDRDANLVVDFVSGAVPVLKP